MQRWFGGTWSLLLGLVLWTAVAQAAGHERRDITFPSQGLKCAGWYYVPADLPPGEKRPVIVMAHGITLVKEAQLDLFASKFADAGFAVLVFDYRFLGASEGEPRQQVLWYEQVADYRNAITWAGLQPEVDPNRIGLWGTSYAGGHVLYVAAFDKRVKAVVSQVPACNVWDAIYAAFPPEIIAMISARNAMARQLRMTTGEVLYWPVITDNGEPCLLRHPESYRWFTSMRKNAPRWENRISVESMEVGMSYDAAAYVHLIAPTPLLMVIASDDIVCPTAQQQKTFVRAGEPKKLVVVPDTGHFDVYQGPRHSEFFTPQLAWFQQHLRQP